MEIKLTTTGTLNPVVINDFGVRSFPHPTTNYSLTPEYTIDEIEHSNDLQLAINQGYINLKDENGNIFTTISGGNIYNTFITQISYTTSATESVFRTGDTMTGDLTIPNLITPGKVDGVDVSNLNAGVNLHTGDTTIHFTKANINLNQIGSSAHTHTIAETTNLQNSLNVKLDSANFNYFSSTTVPSIYESITNFNVHTGDTTIHFTKANINLNQIGSSAHTHTVSQITDYVAGNNVSNTLFNSHTGNTSNPHQTTALQVGSYTIAATDNWLSTKISQSASTAANDFLVGSGSNTFIKKTLAETKTILSIGQAYSSSTTTVTTSSGTDVLLTDMAIIPGAGTYTVWFVSSFSNSNAGRITTFSIYANGSLVTSVAMPNAAANSIYPVQAITTVTVNAGETVEVRWKRDSNTSSCYCRTLLLIKS